MDAALKPPQQDEAVGEARPQENQERIDRLNAMGMSLARTKKEAIDGRVASGIEQIWTEDEEHYEGIDDVNREEKRAWASKPPGQVTPKSQGAQATVFPNITQPYVDTAAAKVGAILLPTDERSWSITETPIAELEAKAKGELPKDAVEGMKGMGMPPEAIEAVRQEEAKVAKEKQTQAHQKAEKAQKRIEDWHIEGQWHAEVRKVIEDCCKIGSGVLKGPVPVSKQAQMFKDGKLIRLSEIKPTSKRIDPWNFFPDPACGENIHNGNYVWERDYLTTKQLRALKDNPDYIASQIDLCLEEGPKNDASESRKLTDGTVISDKDIFQIWYYHGFATKEDLEAAGCKCSTDSVSIPAIFEMVNDRVIKAALNPLDVGAFPYDVMPWRRKKNMPWGQGVGRQIRTPQQMIVAATRVMMTNGGRSAGPVFVMKNGMEGADGTNDILPWKIFYMAEGDNAPDARSAMAMFEIPDRQASMMAIIQYAMKMAEDVTGMPMLLQGQVGAAPETLGGQQMAANNASDMLKRVALIFDDCITEPHVRRYYEWLMQYGEDDEKGDFQIDARGSTSLVERDIYKNEVTQLLQASLNPAFGLDPESTMAEHLRTTKKKPEQFQLSEEKKAQQAKQAQQQQQPQDSSLQVAQVRSKTEMDKAKLNQQSDMTELKFKADEAEKARRHEAAMKNADREIEILKLAQQEKLSVADIKAQLAGKVMQLRTQKELSRMGAKAKNMPKPPTEPAGRAPAGQSFPR